MFPLYHSSRYIIIHHISSSFIIIHLSSSPLLGTDLALRPEIKKNKEFRESSKNKNIPRAIIIKGKLPNLNLPYLNLDFNPSKGTFLDGNLSYMGNSDSNAPTW